MPARRAAEENPAAGRSSRRRGHERMQACVAYLRENFWPAASIETHHYVSDIRGIYDDLALEVTVVGWENIDAKVAQAKRDAEKKGAQFWAVWKHKKRARPGQDYMITDASIFLRMIKLIEEADIREAALRRQLADADRTILIYERANPVRTPF